jgi:uncharacterized protein YndB with AHSA1/START domain
MVRFSVSVDIARPPGDVVEALMRPENAPLWNRGLREFEVVERRPGEVGSVGRLHYVEGGSEHVMEDVMLEADPGRRYVSRVSGPAVVARVETRLEPIEGGTRVTIAWDGSGRRGLVRLLLPLMRGRMRRQAGEELTTFRDLLEARGPDFGGGDGPV